MEGDGVNAPFAGLGEFNLERGDDWSVGVRAGKLLSERTLLYILAAYTQTEYEASGTFNGDAFSQTTTFDGITVGGGIEHALTHNVFLGIEGTHTFYNGEDIFNHYDPAANVGTAIYDDLGETKLLATIKLKLNNGVFGN
jgi:opacity protein-like surface antigen